MHIARMILTIAVRQVYELSCGSTTSYAKKVLSVELSMPTWIHRSNKKGALSGLYLLCYGRDLSIVVFSGYVHFIDRFSKHEMFVLRLQFRVVFLNSFIGRTL